MPPLPRDSEAKWDYCHSRYFGDEKNILPLPGIGLQFLKV
jgi:hypothetical protein